MLQVEIDGGVMRRGGGGLLNISTRFAIAIALSNIVHVIAMSIKPPILYMYSLLLHYGPTAFPHCFLYASVVLFFIELELVHMSSIER